METHSQSGSKFSDEEMQFKFSQPCISVSFELDTEGTSTIVSTDKKIIIYSGQTKSVKIPFNARELKRRKNLVANRKLKLIDSSSGTTK